MIKKIGKALPYVLAGTIAMNTFTGCGISKSVESTTVAESNLENSDIFEEIKNEEPQIVETQPVVEEKRILELVDDIYIDLDEFESIKNDEDQTSMEHVNKLYNYVKKYPIKIDELLEELENVLMAKQVSLSEFDYYKLTLFDRLSWIYPEREGLVDFYYPLAKYMHEQYCTHEHTEEDGILHCPSIDERIDRLNETTLLNGYFVEEIEASQDPVLLGELNKLYICHNIDLDECLNELDAMYYLAMYPGCMDEEEYQEIFSELDKTVGPRQNIFEEYYNLAAFRHMLTCDEEHYTNEFGSIECESGKKKVLGK